ncbi:MAG: hypothetical protein GYA55_05425, partial [SAR324 cluster bacterium]|nr:hypothetical protein [SAR324 cluster bacterium]
MSAKSYLSDRTFDCDPAGLGVEDSLALDPRFMLEFAAYDVWTARADKKEIELFCREMKSRCKRALANPL